MTGPEKPALPRKGKAPDIASRRMTMRSLDFAPLYRATVGFDRIADMMDRVLSSDGTQPTYPPAQGADR